MTTYQGKNHQIFIGIIFVVLKRMLTYVTLLFKITKNGYLLPMLIQVRLVSVISQVNSVDSRLRFGFFMASAVKEYFRKIYFTIYECSPNGTPVSCGKG